jgi:hypothetical protein
MNTLRTVAMWTGVVIGCGYALVAVWVVGIVIAERFATRTTRRLTPAPPTVVDELAPMFAEIERQARFGALRDSNAAREAARLAGHPSYVPDDETAAEIAELEALYNSPEAGR